MLVQLRLIVQIKGFHSCDLLDLFERAVDRVVLADHWTSERVKWQVLRILQIILCRDEGCALQRWLGRHIASIFWQKRILRCVLAQIARVKLGFAVNRQV